MGVQVDDTASNDDLEMPAETHYQEVGDDQEREKLPDLPPEIVASQEEIDRITALVYTTSPPRDLSGCARARQAITYNKHSARVA